MNERLTAYAEGSLAWRHGEKTEDELLQRIWNLAGDVATLAAERDALAADLETTRQALREHVELAARVLAHGKAAYEAGWQGDIAEGYFEDEEAGKLCYSLAQAIVAAASLAAVEDER